VFVHHVTMLAWNVNNGQQETFSGHVTALCYGESYGLTPWSRVLLQKLIVRQEIPLLLRHTKVHHRVHNIRLPDPILSHFNPFLTVTPRVLEINFSTILPSASYSAKWTLAYRYTYLLTYSLTHSMVQNII
jgi:hypothetical protein